MNNADSDFIKGVVLRKIERELTEDLPSKKKRESKDANPVTVGEIIIWLFAIASAVAAIVFRDSVPMCFGLTLTFWLGLHVARKKWIREVMLFGCMFAFVWSFAIVWAGFIGLALMGYAGVRAAR